MTTRNLIAAAALAAIGTAAIASPVTRAEVMAERDAYFAQHDAWIAQGESYGTVSTPMAATAMQSGRLAEFNGTTIDNDVARGEAYGDVALAETTAGSADAYTYQSSQFRVNDAYGAQPQVAYQTASAPSGLTRAEVEAELINARASGEFDARGEVFGDLGNTKFGNLPHQSVAAATPTEETVVLLVPANGDTVTLQPGEAILLVPDGE